MANIGIIGAGAMGCLYGAMLSSAPGNAVTFIDHSKERAEYLQKNGITMHENGIAKRFKVKAVVPAEAHEHTFDWIFILVKAHQTVQALQETAGLLKPGTIIVSLQNGLGNEKNIASFASPADIILGVSSHNSTKIATGEILHPSPAATTVIGPAIGNDTAKAARTAALFAASGTEVVISSDIYSAIWRKLLVNMAINPLTMLSGKKNGFIISDSESWNTVQRLLHEGIVVAGSRGVELDYEEMLQYIYNVCMLTRDGTSSMLQDRLNFRKTEIDYINGAVSAIAEAGEIPAPANKTITEQIHLLEKSYL